MRRIALIVSEELKDYVIDTFYKHTEFNGKISCVINCPSPASPVKRIAFLKRKLYSLLNNLRFETAVFDTVLIVCGERKILLDMIYRVMLSSKNIKDIFFVEPFCAVSKIGFIEGGDFEQKFVKRVPEFHEFNAEYIMNPVISPVSIAKKVFRTQDGIEAYELENVYVKISSSGSLGCMYTSDFSILNSCINGERQFAYDTCIKLFSGTNADVVYDEYVCPLTRLYSSWSVYHFMYEVLDKIIIAEELGYKGKYMLFRNSYAPSLLSMLGIDKERIIWIDADSYGKLFLLNKVFDVEGFILSSKKGLSRLNKFADGASERFDASGDFPSKIFISSDEKTSKPGFTPISPKEYSPEAMMKLFYNADIVMSESNPALTNVLFMRNGKVVSEEFPYNWGSFMLADVISSRELQYHTA